MGPYTDPTAKALALASSPPEHPSLQVNNQTNQQLLTWRPASFQQFAVATYLLPVSHDHNLQSLHLIR